MAKAVRAALDGYSGLWASGRVSAKEVLTLQQGLGQSTLNRTWHVQYSPDGQLLISSYERGGIEIWSAGTGGSAGSYEHHGRVTSIDYTSDGCALASAGDFAGAIPVFERALQLDPSSTAARNNLALARQGLERKKP